MTTDARTAEREARIKRLPKWAQGHIDVLRRNLADAKATQEAVRESRTGLCWLELTEYRLQHYLPRDAHVRFQIGGDGKIEAYFSGDGNLILYSNAPLVLRADSSNVWQIELVKR